MGEQDLFLHVPGWNGKSSLSQIKRGEVVMENEPFEIELINENERIADTREDSLQLLWWYADYLPIKWKTKDTLSGGKMVKQKAER